MLTKTDQAKFPEVFMKNYASNSLKQIWCLTRCPSIKCIFRCITPGAVTLNPAQHLKNSVPEEEVMHNVRKKPVGYDKQSSFRRGKWLHIKIKINK